MAQKYAQYDYVECDYVEGNSCEQDEFVKTFGFSQVDERTLKSDEAQKLKDKQNSRYGRNSFVFPSQEISEG